jgi:hypothetical protein
LRFPGRNWEEKVQHNEKEDWIKRAEKEKIRSMNWMPIKTTETTSFLSKTHNWKSPGSDQRPNYWLKAFMGSWDTKEPKNYRPIACLSAMYKTLTGKIARRISVHLEEHNLLPAEQKECHSGSKGCKDQLLI